jgi:hypothetical protein
MMSVGTSEPALAADAPLDMLEPERTSCSEELADIGGEFCCCCCSLLLVVMRIAPLLSALGFFIQPLIGPRHHVYSQPALPVNFLPLTY